MENKINQLKLSWNELEDWTLACYKLGFNPLPVLRHTLGIPVEFRYAPAVYELAEGHQGLICELKTDNEQNPEWVKLIVIDEEV